VSASAPRRTVAIIGASNDRRKFGNRAVRAYARQGYDVKPVHPTETAIEGLPVYRTIADIPGSVDVVSMYVPASIGIALLDAVAAKAPTELWINPGAESGALVARAKALGLSPILACSIVAIGEIPV
jgi:predicted CoA-binding protein